jgi:hypothetical protein
MALDIFAYSYIKRTDQKKVRVLDNTDDFIYLYHSFKEAFRIAQDKGVVLFS